MNTSLADPTRSEPPHQPAGRAVRFSLEGAPAPGRVVRQTLQRHPSRPRPGWSPLHHAVWAGDKAEVATLVAEGVSPDTVDVDGMTALMTAVCAEVEDVTLVGLLLDLGADPSRASDSVPTVLHAAARFGRAATVAPLLSHGARVDAASIDGVEPLSVAGSAEVVALLLGAGANVAAKNHYALLWASGNADPECLGLLLDAGGDIDAHRAA